ncbi:hypothetical protein [Burkholderia territorii]
MKHRIERAVHATRN